MVMPNCPAGIGGSSPASVVIRLDAATARAWAVLERKLMTDTNFAEVLLNSGAWGVRSFRLRRKDTPHQAR